MRPRQRPFRHLPEVARWLKTFEQVDWRYKCLVLTGPSRTGKTRYACSLAPEGQVLELNMATAPEADLRGFDPTVHTLVVMDEISPSQALRQKKLYQSPPCPIQVGSSATNCHSYEVWVHQVRFVLCSNKWREELAGHEPEDRKWLEANTVVIDVKTPLWECA